MCEFEKNVAVMMSVYKNDKVDWLQSSIQSILKQTYKNLELFIAVDGPVSDDIRFLLDTYQRSNIVHIFYFNECKGLATRLNFLIEKIIDFNKFEYIARMDADDISFQSRIEKQVTTLDSSDCDVVGSSVIEINDSGDFLFEKKMNADHADLIENIIKKCPFNHPTVIFRISIFLDGIRYDSKMKNTQDYKLWIELASLGYKFGNVEESLLYFRVSNDFHSRRSFSKAKNDFTIRLSAMKKLNNYTIKNCLHVIFLYIVRISPSFISKLVYRHFR